jgi:hypothetical protein
MLKWIVNMLDRIFAVIGALVFSQAPMFMQQYKQQLAGHVAELHIQIDAINKAALESGKTLDAFIQKFTTNADLDFMRQGEVMQNMTERYRTLLENYAALTEASAFTKPFVFISNLHNDIVQSTFKTFNFGLEFSLEGLIYALVGIFLGYSLFAGIRRIFATFLGLFSRKSKTVV